jgi:hypothetical protein
MANTFKNSISGSIGTANTIVYQAPAATSTTVIGMSVANTNTNNINVSATLTSAGQSKTVYIVKNATIPVGGSVVFVGGEQKIAMSAGDYISVQSSLATSADVIVSVLEIS